MKILGRVIDRLPAAPRVADLGSGTGRTTLALAAALPEATISAIDLSEIFCRRLRAEAAKQGLSQRVDVREADMAAPPLAANSMDLIWSEGAAYNIGFETALRAWRSLLKPKGIAVVSECSWLGDDRPADVAAFWAAAYPDMGTREANISRATAAGFETIDTYILPAECWNDYYLPIVDAIQAGRASHLSPAFVAELEQERAIWAASRGSYGYVFYILQPRVHG